MQDDELEAFVGRSDAQRAIIVSSMLIEPRLSYNGEGEGNTRILLTVSLSG